VESHFLSFVLPNIHPEEIAMTSGIPKGRVSSHTFSAAGEIQSK
jgi:hypothetical protein